jgi:hypothetical protein
MPKYEVRAMHAINGKRVVVPAGDDLLAAGTTAQRMHNESGGYMAVVEVGTHHVAFVSSPRSPGPTSVRDRRFTAPNPVVVEALRHQRPPELGPVELAVLKFLKQDEWLYKHVLSFIWEADVVAGRPSYDGGRVEHIRDNVKEYFEYVLGPQRSQAAEAAGVPEDECLVAAMAKAAYLTCDWGAVATAIDGSWEHPTGDPSPPRPDGLGSPNES